MKFILTSIFTLIAVSSFAKEVLPSGCVPKAIDSNEAILYTNNTSFFMIHNISEHDLWLTHPVVEPSASAGFSSNIKANKWSAFVLVEPSFKISCVETKPGHEQQVPCADVIALCEFPNIAIPQNLYATFWAGENMSLAELIAYVGRRGFVLPN